jgi:hypothetical protein
MTFAPAAKSYHSYVKEPTMLIPNKEPCYVDSAEEALESAGLASSK